jgi:transcriptional regulator with XRE-family HTH domain
MDEPENLLQAIGDRIAARRKAKGWSQADLAKTLGKHTNSVSRWETGAQEMAVGDALALAKALDVSVQELLEPRPDVGILRSSSIYFLSPDRIEKLRFAKTRDDLLGLLSLTPEVGVVIEPSDVQVTEQQFRAAVREASEMYRQRSVGPIARVLAKLRRRGSSAR